MKQGKKFRLNGVKMYIRPGLGSVSLTLHRSDMIRMLEVGIKEGLCPVGTEIDRGNYYEKCLEELKRSIAPEPKPD